MKWEDIPQYKTKGLFGTVRELKEDHLGLLTRAVAQLGDTFRIRFVTKDYLFTARPEYIRSFLSDTTGKYTNQIRANRYIQQVLGNGMLTTSDEPWQRHRQNTQGYLFHKEISSQSHQIGDVIAEHMDGWQEYVKRQTPVDLHYQMRLLTLTVFNRVFLEGLLEKEDMSVFIRNIEVMSTIALKRAKRAFHLPEFFNTHESKAFNGLKRQIHTILQKALERRKKKGNYKNSLLDAILKDSQEYGGVFSKKDVYDQLITFIWTGYDTTATGLFWSWVHLFENPSSMERLYSDVDQNLGGKPPTEESLSQIPWPKYIFQEAIRLNPPCWQISRIALKENTISGIHIREGVGVMTCQYICHRHPEYWDDPERFKPERFESVDVKDIDPYLYFPFGAGPRRCVGFHLALLEAQFILLQIAQRYYFRKESQNNITLKPGFVLSVQKPFYVRITARNE